MQSRLLLALAVAISFSSCATYRSGVTPDDVYYSPERRINRYQENQNRESSASNEDYRLRQQIRDARLRTIDNDFYWNYNNNWQAINRPVWGHGWYGLGSPFNYWNNPFYCIPGTNFVVSTPGKGNVIKTSPRYTPSITTLNNQPRNTGTTSNGKFGTRSSGNGSRFFGGATNQSGSSFRFNYPSGGSGNYNSGSSGGGGSRTFGSGSSSSGRSSSGSSGTRSRRN
jgi:hypothetical protein